MIPQTDPGPPAFAPTSSESNRPPHAVGGNDKDLSAYYKKMASRHLPSSFFRADKRANDLQLKNGISMVTELSSSSLVKKQHHDSENNHQGRRTSRGESSSSSSSSDHDSSTTDQEPASVAAWSAKGSTLTGAVLLQPGWQSQKQQSLRFDQLGLVNREHEQRVLSTTYSAMVKGFIQKNRNKTSDNNNTSKDLGYTKAKAASTTTSPCSFVLISGPSGSGKSALVHDLKTRTIDATPPSEIKAFFASGKCNITQDAKDNEPYSGIRAALMHLCDQLAMGDDDAAAGDESGRSELRRVLRKQISSEEASILSNVIPNLQELLTPTVLEQPLQKQHSNGSLTSNVSAASSALDSTGMRQESRVSTGYREHGDRLNFALRRFLRVITKHTPLVLAVDDLQWADATSLDIIQAWLSDTRIASLMIVGCYRSIQAAASGNEGIATSNVECSPDALAATETATMLHTKLQEIEASKRQRSIKIVRMQLEEMRVEQINELLLELFSFGVQLSTSSSSSSSDGDSESVGTRQSSNFRDDAGDTVIEAASAVNYDAESVSDLARAVHLKTAGNAYFIQQFLQSLTQQRLLSFDVESKQWAWDANRVASDSTVTSNVIDLMLTKLKQLDAAKILPVAACIGSTFSFANVNTLIRGLSIHSSHSQFCNATLFNKQTSGIISTSDIKNMIRRCEKEGLIERKRVSRGTGTKGSVHHSFAHDKVQEAAHALLPPDQLSELKYRVGEVLLSSLSPDELDEKLFVVAGLINTRLDLVPDRRHGANRRMKIAMINHKAGLKAVACSAFSTASAYFKNAINLLPEDHWKQHFRESLDMYNSIAQCESVIGNRPQARKYCNMIVALDCDILDKVKAYHTLIDVALADAATHSGTECIDLCLSLLAKFGCRFPKTAVGRSMATLLGILNLKRTTKKFNPDMIMQLDVVANPVDVAVSATLGKLALVAMVTSSDLTPLVCLKTTKQTVKHGVSPHSAPAFQLQGLLLGFFLGDFKGARRLGDTSLRMLQMTDDRTMYCRTIVNYYNFNFHWTGRHEDSLEPLGRAFQIGMETGDVEFAMWAAHTLTAIKLFTQSSLAEIDEQMATNAALMKDYRQDFPCTLTRCSWQIILNLRGLGQYTTKLIGDAFDEREAVVNEDSTLATLNDISLNAVRLIAATYYGEYRFGAEVGIKSTDKETLQKIAGSYAIPGAMCQTALCCYAICNDDTKKQKHHRKYRGHAQRCHKQLKAWKKKGHQNLLHLLTLLDAEASHSKPSMAEWNYRQSIKEAKSRGVVQDAALGEERYAAFLLKIGDKVRARSHLEQAIRWYDDWGASKKVEMLRGQLSDM